MRAQTSTVWWLTLATAASLAGASFALSRLDDGTALRLAIACVPIALYAATLLRIARVKSREDEMLRRIQMEALSIAFPLGLFAIVAIGYVVKALDLGWFEFVDGALLLLIAYSLSFAMVQQRYR